MAPLLRQPKSDRMDAQKPAKSNPSPPKQRRHRCPTCHRSFSLSGSATSAASKVFPFCSERCKLVDLGAWLDEGYRIPARPDDGSDDASETDPIA
jgi:endogenous inhibitor of DNA gyrase (YacG/DUF329 family)